MSNSAWFGVVVAVFGTRGLVRGAATLIASAFAVAVAAGPALAATPSVTTGPVTNLTTTSATFNGTMSANGETITSEGFSYGTAASGCSPSHTGSCTIVMNAGSPTSPSATALNLSPSTTYVVFLAAEDSASGWYYGQPEQFTTAAPPAPSISLGSTVVSTKSCDQGGNAVAQLNATVSIDDPDSQDTWGAGFYYSDTKLPFGPNGPQGLAQLTHGGGQLAGVGSDQKVTAIAPRAGRLAPGTYYYFVQVAGRGPAWAQNGSWGSNYFYSSEGKFVVTTSCGTPSGDVTDSLGVSGPSGTIGVILRAEGYPAIAVAPGPGTLTITWRYGKSTVIASGTKKFGTAGRAPLKLRLTSQGRALLEKSHNITLSAIGSFKPNKGKTVTKHRTITLHKSALP